MDILTFKNKIWDLTRQIMDGMDAVFRPISEQNGLTRAQLQILLKIRIAEQPETVGSLGKHMGISAGNMSSMCKKLEQDGFLQRCRDAQDERIVRLTLSDKGMGAIAQINELIEQQFRDCLCNMGEKKIEAIVDSMQELSRILAEMSAGLESGGAYINGTEK